MSDGAKHHGVDSAHIEFLKNHKCVPRTLPPDFKKFDAVPEGAPTYTADDLVKFNGKDGQPFYITINSKVREYVLEDPEVRKNTIERYGRMGRHSDVIMSKMLYDPKYGTPASVNELTREHAAYVEDMVYRFAEIGNSTLHHWKVVAHFDQKYLD